MHSGIQISEEYLQKKQKLIAICFIYLCLSVCVCEKLRERERSNSKSRTKPTKIDPWRDSASRLIQCEYIKNPTNEFSS